MTHLLRIIAVLVILCFASPSRAEDDFTIRKDPVTNERFFIFNSPKGKVRFNHNRHQAEMKEQFCLPCHKTKTPTKAHTMTRFDKLAAHSFCKGCHKNLGRGPVECHECHKEQQ